MESYVAIFRLDGPKTSILLVYMCTVKLSDKIFDSQEWCPKCPLEMF